MQLYKDLERLCKEMKKISTATTIIAGDFNAKIGKRQGEEEQCLGAWSRGRRNESGSKLIEFCEKVKKIITNSCFKHPAKHMTTWSQQRTDSQIGIVKTIYNQIDYIIIDQKHKHSLTDARSFSGTETYSDHRIVVSRMDVNWATLYKQETHNTRIKSLNIKLLAQNKDAQAQYQSMIKQQLQNEVDSVADKWENTKEIIMKSAKSTIGYKPQALKHQISDGQLKEWSTAQKDLRLQIEKSKVQKTIQTLKSQRKTIVKQMRKRKKELRETEIDNILKEVDTTKDDIKMFKAVKALHTKRKQISYIDDEDGKSVSNPQEIYNVINKYFKKQFSKPNQGHVSKFKTDAKKLRKPITTEEVTQAVSKMSNNKAPGKDEIHVEMVNYGPKELHSEIATLLNSIFEHNNATKMGTGILLPIPKPNKAQGKAKNLRPITLLETIRKILSKIFMNRRHKSKPLSFSNTKCIQERAMQH